MTGYQSGRTIAWVVTVLLVIEVACHGLLSLAQCLEAFVLGGSIEEVSDSGSPTFLATALLLAVGALGQLGALLFCVIGFLTWFYRAAKNAALFATDPLEHSPGWAIGGFFVPILNLVRPYQVARQIETASGGLASPILSAWWGAFIVNNFLGNIEFRVEGIEPLAYLGIASTLSAAVAAFFCVRMMFYVEGLQAERARSPHDIAAVFA